VSPAALHQHPSLLLLLRLLLAPPLLLLGLALPLA
jgi:hypothetical protein